jgi:hypothetical protein
MRNRLQSERPSIKVVVEPPPLEKIEDFYLKITWLSRDAHLFSLDVRESNGRRKASPSVTRALKTPRVAASASPNFKSPDEMSS